MIKFWFVTCSFDYLQINVHNINQLGILCICHVINILSYLIKILYFNKQIKQKLYFQIQLRYKVIRTTKDTNC